MKTILLLLSLFLTTSLFAQELNSNIQRDLKSLHRSEVGGGGNGGGQLALIIAREINTRAAALKIPDLKKFRAKYKLLVGEYVLCLDHQPDCDALASYYVKEHAVLVDKVNWLHSSPAVQLATIDRLIQAINSAR